ncbi:IQ domain-containing protein G isoform X2 [Octodon degus]|uniref:Dynein regulatory complex protein 9 n=1 Tax=Octodon degus TaxID=10160 RepID=A0A6P6DKE8_OCTDE|nr:IQ domain-containing protein G isoform X2 [Octodon degus]
MEEDSLEALSAPPEAWPEAMALVTGEPPSVAEEAATAEEPEAKVALSLLEVLTVSVVLEDMGDQLSILGYIMPWPLERRQSAAPVGVRSNSPDKPSVTFATSKTSSSLLHKVPLSPEAKAGGQLATEFNKTQELAFKTPTGQAILTMEMLKKTQSDRQFLSNIIVSTMQELQESGTFMALLQALRKEKESKMHFYDAIVREEKGRKMIKSLQKQLINVKKERQAEVQSRNKYIAHLKDQLQEMKAKTNLENRHMKRNTELQIAQTQKKCNRTEEVLLEEIEKLRMKTEEENRVHVEIEMFLKKEQQIREYEQVIIEDRIEKEKARKKMEQDMLELKSAIKLQAWWRGTVIRKEIGGFKMPKKEKDDSKDSKGKDKDKQKRRGKK